jgi:hypothetical protein
MRLAFSTTYHPQIDGHTEKGNIMLEDMLRMHVVHQLKQWEEYLPLIEFSYNNNYNESLKMSLFEVMYGRKCRFPINWDNPVDKITLGLELLKEMEHAMVKIRQNMKVSQDRQKSYGDSKSTHIKFKVGDHVYLWVKPKRISLRMGTCAKLAPCYYGPFEVLEKIGPIAYKIALPPTIIELIIISMCIC